MKKVAAGNVTCKGLDVSHWDETIAWQKVKDAGFRFAVAKCTEYKQDPTYLINKNGARSVGMIFGAYHFFHPSRDPIVQAQEFVAKAGLCDFFVLDWESTDGVPSAKDRGGARIWLEFVEKLTGKVPVIYGSPYFLQALGLDESFARYPLWVANYKTSAPLVPEPWKTWTFWQFTESGDVPGIPAPDEDCDIFNGSIIELKKLVGLT